MWYFLFKKWLIFLKEGGSIYIYLKQRGLLTQNNTKYFTSNKMFLGGTNYFWFFPFILPEDLIKLCLGSTQTGLFSQFSGWSPNQKIHYFPHYTFFKDLLVRPPAHFRCAIKLLSINHWILLSSNQWTNGENPITNFLDYAVLGTECCPISYIKFGKKKK